MSSVPLMRFVYALSASELIVAFRAVLHVTSRVFEMRNDSSVPPPTKMAKRFSVVFDQFSEICFCV